MFRLCSVRVPIGGAWRKECEVVEKNRGGLAGGDLLYLNIGFSVSCG